MTNFLVVVLTLAYILVAFVGPVAVLGLSGYWAYTWASSEDGGIGGAIAVFILSAVVMLLILMALKKMLKVVMNKVDLGDEEEAID